MNIQAYLYFEEFENGDVDEYQRWLCPDCDYPNELYVDSDEDTTEEDCALCDAIHQVTCVYN